MRSLPRFASMALALLVAAPAAAAAADSEPLRAFSVSGTGEVRATPDTAAITLGVSSESETAGGALTRNTESMNRVMQRLKADGLADKDLQTSDFSISPRYAQMQPGEQAQRINGYIVSNQLHVRVRDLKKLGAILDSVVRAGANSVYGISFTVDAPKPLMAEARKRAVAEARAIAQQLADAAGVKIGRLMSMSEGGGGPVPLYRSGMKIEPMAMMEAAPVPISAGEQTISATVSLTYEIQ